ncbi:hypothetical protein A2U01_0031467 [Trifolium medium]|uniref:Uncharacterized protein n=1 Tax=Trifolium medium TaxID=97028 RepID=A0A392PEZ2_9FABA|nr:hypothetical protein [Trifolium medium]
MGCLKTRSNHNHTTRRKGRKSRNNWKWSTGDLSSLARGKEGAGPSSK